MSSDPDRRAALRAWEHPPAGRVIGRGHPAGDFLEAHEWSLLASSDGSLELECSLPPQVLNPRGQLFGGFTPTYVDLVALLTVRAASAERRPVWLATLSMHVDYFEPVVGPRFRIESRLELRRKRTCFVVTRFLQSGGLAVHAETTLREMPHGRPLGDA